MTHDGHAKSQRYFSLSGLVASLEAAWSRVDFNLSVVYRPVMNTLFGYGETGLGERSLAPRHEPVLGWRRAHHLALAAMDEAARANGFSVLRERLLHFDPDRGVYEYRVLSTLDVGEKLGNTTLFLDARTGTPVHLDLPTGAHAGNTLDTWMSSLHTAAWGGLPMQSALCASGLAVVSLTVTGVLLWWQRRRARRFASSR